VSCPKGGGTCVTQISFAVVNVGLGDAGGFNIRIVADPRQSVVVGRQVIGLASRAAQGFTVTTPPGGNCYDPDCTVCVVVDSGNDVSESNEGNNELCTTRGG
jgi:subtilase family serine protease